MEGRMFEDEATVAAAETGRAAHIEDEVVTREAADKGGQAELVAEVCVAVGLAVEVRRENMLSVSTSSSSGVV